MTDRLKADVAIVGAGIAGTGLAAQLGGLSVALLEAEDRPGRHSTGRSAAIFIRSYGNAPIRALTRASEKLFAEADPAFFPTPILSPRGILHVASADTTGFIDVLMGYGTDGLERISPGEALAMVPLVRREWLAAAAYEADAQDIDVAALHAGFLSQARRHGATLLVEAPLRSARRESGVWVLETPAATVEAGIVVNAAGAWADRVAELCGLAPLGIQPMRRSIAVLPAPAPLDLRRWPLVADAAERWYAKPEAGRLLVSGAEEEPVEPQDAYPDDLVLAEGLDRFSQAMSFPVERVERAWAGLRSFAPDRTPLVGFDPRAKNVFWLAGQGGYGIQTAPALSVLAAQLLKREAPPAGLGQVVPALDPGRFVKAS